MWPFKKKDLRNCPINISGDDLEELIVRLKSGRYDKDDIKRALFAIDALFYCRATIARYENRTDNFVRSVSIHN